ncbi:ATPase domain-containing protein [Bacillus coahuilensis]|uniref:ATPase domain-containing protein n=1 Tax=Bacillus coahuilensis TaxID=408580 RepID=UPI0009E707CA
MSTSPDSFVSELLSGEGLLRSLIVELGIKRVVIDSVTLFQYRRNDEKEKRELLYSIRNALNKLGCTTLFISESFQENGEIHYAHFILDGVITLHLEKDRHQRIRKMEVKKLRGSDFVDGPCVWDITERGITVILPKKLPKALPPHIPYIQTGIKKLDDYLGGGIVSGSRWLVNIDEISRYKMLLGSIFMERIKAGENFLCRLSPSTLVRDIEDYFSSQGYSLLEFARNGRIYFIEQYKRPVPEELMPFIIRAYDSMDVDLFTLIEEKQISLDAFKQERNGF